MTVTSPISKKSCRKAGLLYVDDTSLWAGMDRDEDLDSAVLKVQAAIDSWGNLLQATEGRPQA